MRQAAAVVAHVLHTPLTALDAADVEDVLDWAEDAGSLLERIYGSK